MAKAEELRFSEELKVSQVAPPRGVDRFQIAFRTRERQLNQKDDSVPDILRGEGPDGKYKLCAGGSRYPLRLVITYDDNRSLVTDSLTLLVNYTGASAITK
jgi:hypothetical protein